MAFQSQFKTTPKMCRNGTRENCPVQKCRFQHTMPAQVIYSTVPKGAVPPPPTRVPSPARTQFPSAEHGARGWCGDVNAHAHAQHVHSSVEDATPRDMNDSATAPSGTTLDANALAQATDGLAMYRAWLESQVEAQKAKIQAMSKQYDIPVPQLELDPLGFPPLGMRPPTMVANNNFRGQQPDIPSAPQAPRLEPAQPFPRRAPMHVPQSVPATNRYNYEGLNSATPTYTHANLDSMTTVAPRKLDMSYKTTPCRHFTVNRGWCPWGDDCCFIHDAALEWVPPPDRGSSGRSTPSSTMLVGGTYKPGAPYMNGAAEPGPGPAMRSSSSQSAHCWGYIQGLCPHPANTCKFLHPSNVLPYIKYTPCLSWPRCGYPTQECPLKHPQVDNLNLQTSPPPPPPQTVSSASASQSELLVIPHDAAYASAVQYHNPVPPSAETFTPPPQRVAVRLSYPSSSDVVSATGPMVGGFGALGGGGLQGRGRRVSIAVQREFVGGDGKEFVRGHGRGRSMM